MILYKVSTLGDTMRDLYEEFVNVHKKFVRSHELQWHIRECVKILKNIQASIIVVHEWTMRYKATPLTLVKKMKS